MHIIFIELMYLMYIFTQQISETFIVFDKLSTVYKMTTNLKRVLQMTLYFINDIVKSMTKIPYNSQPL